MVEQGASWVWEGICLWTTSPLEVKEETCAQPTGILLDSETNVFHIAAHFCDKEARSKEDQERVALTHIFHSGDILHM